VRLRLHHAALPFHPGAQQYAQDLLFPAMANGNDFYAACSVVNGVEYTVCPNTYSVFVYAVQFLAS